MKKVLFVTLALAVGMTGFAQTKNMPVKAEKMKHATANIHKVAYRGNEPAPMEFSVSPSAPMNSSKNTDFPYDVQTMKTYYDLQANGYVANRMHRFEDGTVGLVATWGQNGPSFPDRGTGYDYFNGSEFLWDEENNPLAARVEIEKTGWPCYAQYGPEGEIIIAHTGNELTYYFREKKGQGAWDGPHYIQNPDASLPQPAAGAAMTWPKIITSGANHDIIHVLGADQDSDNLGDTYLYYCRSTDGDNWTISMVPMTEEWEQKAYSSDYYALAANGDNVAILLCGDVMSHGLIIKSTDNGETWTRIKFWDNPYAGLDWETDPNSLFGEDNAMYGPETGAICIDNDGMIHCAFSSKNYYHAELGTTYNFYHGKGIDGIFYWNETMGTLQAPEWVCPEDGTVIPSNPHNCFRLWWPYDGAGEYVTRNFVSSNVVGLIDPEVYNDMNNDNIFCEQVYYQFWSACSVLPSICVDESGTVAVGYSVPDFNRVDNNNMYLRSICVSFIEPGYVMADAYGEYTEEIGNVYYNMFKLQDADDFMHSYDEAIFTMSPQNTTNEEFWFGYQADDQPGLFVGNNANQTSASDNYIWAVMVKPDFEGLGVEENVVAENTKMEVYPNPAVSELNVRLENSAEINVFNIMGQNVLNMQGVKGVNQINISDLTSGVYFISAGSVTQKFIVK